MGVNNEKKEPDRRTVSSGNKRSRRGTADSRNRAWCFGARFASNRVCGSPGSDQRSGLASCRESMGGSFEPNPKRLRASYGGAAGTSSLHRQKMGRGSQEEGAKEMKVLVTANQKGGVGKTSTLVHLAFDFCERGLKVAVIDLDLQGNASYTLQAWRSGVVASSFFNGVPVQVVTELEENMALIESDAALADMEKLTVADAGERFRAGVASLAEQGFDVCLIDTAPSLGISMVAALLSADFVLSPVELEVYAIQGIRKMVMTIANVRKANPKLQFIGMVPSKVDARNPRHGRHLEELEQAYPKLIVPVSVGLRSSMADALASGVPVWQIKKTAARKAAKEIRALADLVYKRMEITK